MDNKELFNILKNLSVPVAYQSFKKPTTLPFMVFKQAGSDNFGADNIVYEKHNNYHIELYSKDKNFELEERLEELLNQHEIYWNKSADIRIEDENLTEIIYYI